ncbi:alpha-ketoglutarate-dependent dioxygenase alkB homolog 4-like [Oscarella lobularis]|uniref:alpha-ketoglutarate-dependent dioxygenase alkB homolog 4-like n=1 Tax=Oscarella lobularis TaxID=121494 RepID=UPI0033142A83
MTTDRLCGCTGIRSCLLCEEGRRDGRSVGTSCSKRYVYAGNKSRDELNLDGIAIFDDFVDEDAERAIVAEIDDNEWKESQSGRRKQDFGPRPNFKKRKIKIGSFSGLPPFSKSLVERMWKMPLLASFVPVELCNLEYLPTRGSSIDPHIDDEWLWGERLVTLNLLSDTYLTFTRDDGAETVEILVKLPRRSLVIVSDKARHDWLHAIRREHIRERRIAVTLRELSDKFADDEREMTTLLKDLALTFRGKCSS